MITAIDGYVLKCERCKRVRSEVGFKIGMKYNWANNHGTSIRLFCSFCGAVHNVTLLKSATEPKIELCNWTYEPHAPVTEAEAVELEISEE